MKGIAGPVMILVVLLGFFIYRASSGPDTPARSFTNLELAGADEDHTGSCYALSTVLIANGWWGDVPRHWESKRENVWIFVVEDVQQGFNGPVHVFQKFTFEKFGKTARLVWVEGSKGMDTDVDKTIDRLLQDPNARHSTPVDRCLEPGATGYRFVGDKR
ncbi:MAG: hypothetical protein H7Y89_15035 [Steroidobacteraceae bacterium]|nr:hypothetical protein [Steroidobacteraceae bacterium]